MKPFRAAGTRKRKVSRDGGRGRDRLGESLDRLNGSPAGLGPRKSGLDKAHPEHLAGVREEWN